MFGDEITDKSSSSDALFHSECMRAGSYVCTYHCAQLSYTTQHRTILIIFPLLLQTVVISQMNSTEGEGKIDVKRCKRELDVGSHDFLQLL